MHLLHRTVLACVAALAMLTTALAAGPINLDGRGVALHGHDPVAYFIDAKATAGRAEHRVTMAAATYWFVSDANRKLFETDPARYLPQYGGYCAYGVAHGAKPDIDPTAFRIVDGKLYLNLSPAIQKRWQEDMPGHIARADKNWPSLQDQ